MGQNDENGQTNEPDLLAIAQTPKSVSGDEGTVTERSISELIEADRYSKNQQVCKPPYGMRMAKIRFPGTQG